MNKVKLQVENNNKSLKYKGFSEVVERVIQASFSYMFPGYCSYSFELDNVVEVYRDAFRFVLDADLIDEKLNAFLDTFPKIKDSIICDIDAAYRGDPATYDYDEIILTYPCFRAISAHRFAHELFKLEVPILPRAISEYMHRLTGIDIHPGATIGKSFFIDHGTGVVIGQTCIIGDDVTIYQNVTLGAKSFPHDDEGNLIKGIKRHPNIGNNVVIYSGATILGDITIGDNCVIGGNVWLVHSVDANSTITN